MTGNVVRIVVVGVTIGAIGVACLRSASADPLVAQVRPSRISAALREVDRIQDDSRRDLEAFLRREPTSAVCKIGFQLGPSRPFIVALSARAEGTGLRRGDFLKSIAGLPVAGLDDVARVTARISPGTVVAVVVERNSQEVKLPARCALEPDAWAAVKRALAGAASGDWDTCQEAALDIVRARGFVSSNALALRAECAMAQTAVEGIRQPGLPIVRLVYEWRRAEIQERSYEPGGLEEIRGPILATVTLLREEGFRELANDLEEQLRMASQRGQEE